MSMEQELRALLRDRADLIRPEEERRRNLLIRARRRRASVVVVGTMTIVAAIVASVSAAGIWSSDDFRPAPVQQHEDEATVDDEPEANVVIAEAEDGSWTLRGGLDDGGKTLCLSLGGMGCTGAHPPDGFVVFTAFESVPSQTGFLYGVVGPEVAMLELFTGGRSFPLDLGGFPKRLRMGEARYFVRPIRGVGVGELVARDAQGDVVQRTEVLWGGADSADYLDARATDLRKRLGGFCREFDFQRREPRDDGMVRPVQCERPGSKYVHIKLYVFSDAATAEAWIEERLEEVTQEGGIVIRDEDWVAQVLDEQIAEEVRNRLIPQ